MSGGASSEIRWLCSQILEFLPGGGHKQAAVLEEIAESTAIIAVDDPIESGTEITLLGLPDSITATVSDFTVRETDFALRLEFAADYRWSPAAWLPAHGVDVTPRAKSTTAGAGES